MAEKRPAFPLARWREAMDWFSERLSLSRKQMQAIEKRARKGGAAGAELAQLRAANTVMEKIKQAVAQGKTLPQVRKELAAAVVKDAQMNVELAFINNTQRAYNAGRVREFMEPETLELRPYWLFDATMDHRTSPLCAACNGTLLPARSAWWKTHVPPLHHRCRSTVRAVSPEEARQLGVDTRGPRASAQAGFGLLSDALPKPDLSNVDPGLRTIFKAKRRSSS